MTSLTRAVVQVSLDDLRSDDVRFLQEAARVGQLHVRVPSDELLTGLTGSAPKFPQAERLFLAESLRWVASTEAVDHPISAALHHLGTGSVALVTKEEHHDPELQDSAKFAHVAYHVVSKEDRAGLPLIEPAVLPDGAPTAIVTAPDSGFAVDTNRVTIFERNGERDDWPLMSKEEVAQAILQRVVARLGGRRVRRAAGRRCQCRRGQRRGAQAARCHRRAGHARRPHPR